MSPDAIRRRVREKLQEQRDLVEELLHQREQLQGSLFARWAVCGKEGCACREGRKHGPYYVLSTRSGGQTSVPLPADPHRGGARGAGEAHPGFTNRQPPPERGQQQPPPPPPHHPAA